MLNHITGTTDARGRVITVLGNLVASTGNNETRRCGNIKRVLAVAARTNDIYVAVAVEDSGNARL